MATKKTGRPVKEVDFDKIDKLCEYHCTAQEITDYLNTRGDGVSYNTIERRIKKVFGVTFGEYIKQKHNAFAKPKLRELQWKAAESGNIVMLIWLGKQYLGQKDKSELTGKDDGPVKYARDLTEEQLEAIASRAVRGSARIVNDEASS